jgi:CrcB protein
MGKEPFSWIEWLQELATSKVVLLSLGGSAGTCLRYWLGQWFKSHPWGQVFPWGTLTINVSGSFILAFVVLFLTERLPPERQQLGHLLVAVGFCGGYTTFSTFEWETFQLVQSGSWGLALTNVLGSVLAGFVGVVCGVVVFRLLFPQ